MRLQDFEAVVEGEPSLIQLVERAVVDAHRRWHLREGRQWSEPLAYRWLHYEDPDPLARLVEGLRRLEAEGVEVDAALARTALAEGLRRGFEAI